MSSSMKKILIAIIAAIFMILGYVNISNAKTYYRPSEYKSSSGNYSITSQRYLGYQQYQKNHHGRTDPGAGAHEPPYQLPGGRPCQIFYYTCKQKGAFRAPSLSERKRTSLFHPGERIQSAGVGQGIRGDRHRPWKK